MLSLLIGAALAAEPAQITVTSDQPAQVTHHIGRGRPMFAPLCTAPCTASVEADTPVLVRVKADGKPAAVKRIRFDGAPVELEHRPGNGALLATGGVLAISGLALSTTASVLNTANPGSGGLVLPLSGLALAGVAIPFTVAGSSKLKKRR